MAATKVIVFGTAQRGSETYAILSQLAEYKVVAFSCNIRENWGTKKEGLPVIPPEDIARAYQDAIVVIASFPHYVEIRNQLLENHLVAADRCLDSIYEILKGLSDTQRSELKNSVERSTSFYDLDYKDAELPASGDTRNKYLVICNGGYPKEGNARCMFVHQRILQYIKTGLEIEAFGLVEGAALEQYEYQGVPVLQGSLTGLKQLLQQRKYKKILIHFLDRTIIDILEQVGKVETPLVVWYHGDEVEPWSVYWFNYTPEELAAKQTSFELNDRARSNCMKRFFKRADTQFIFVSKWLANRAKKFVGTLPENSWVIHNFINTDFFALPPKHPRDRLRILSIKSHLTRRYSNDLTAKAILELSKRSFFPQLSFELYGDGVLFEDNFSELIKRSFPNVHIHRKVLSHVEIRDLFRKNGVFLSPTRSDTQGVIANEAMAAGMAVISCNTAAIPEFIDEDCGSLFEFDNYWMMADEIEYLYYHPDEFLRKSANAARRMREQCGFAATIERELQIIKS